MRKSIAAEIIGRFEARKQAQAAKLPEESLRAMSDMWRAMLVQRHGASARELTQKERGQIGRLIHKVGAPAAASVIFGCTRDWPGFVQELVYVNKRSHTHEPDIGTMLVNVDVALRLITAGWPNKTVYEIRNEATMAAVSDAGNPWEIK